MIKIAHIADVHLRDRQYSCRTRGHDFANALESAVKTAIENHADAIICAGDLLDTARPSAATISGELTRIDRILLDANIPMFVISGNHDLAEFPWMKVFDPHSTKTAGIVCADNMKKSVYKNDEFVNILCLPFMSTEDMKQTLDSVRESGKFYDIITWHGAVSEFVGYPNPNNLDMDNFAGTCRLVAMGDQHVHRLLEKEIDGNMLTVTYPGSTEMCDEAEDPIKKMYMYSWENHELVNIESIPFKTRPVQRFILKTELDVEDAITRILPNALVFVKYNRKLSNVIPRLNTVLTSENILRPAALPDSDKKTMKDIQKTRQMLASPREFVDKAISNLVAEDQLDRIKELCLDMVDSNADYRYSIDKFCADQMDGKIIL